MRRLLPALLAAVMAGKGSPRSVAMFPAHMRCPAATSSCSREVLGTMGPRGVLLPRLSLRGGARQAESCYPLQGEGDTEGDIHETVTDDGEIELYSVKWVDSKNPPSGADPLEAALLDELSRTPDKVSTLIMYANLLFDTRKEFARAREVVLRVHAIEPDHWWLAVHGHKYVPELASMPPPDPAQQAARDAIPEPMHYAEVAWGPNEEAQQSPWMQAQPPPPGVPPAAPAKIPGWDGPGKEWDTDNYFDVNARVADPPEEENSPSDQANPKTSNPEA
ncbi:hypothetical protein T484DRAFT_2828977 [Baffinella frigidus]|nr:hypothetical protein T484DRAFT_2828977 [Cryptophyta sp. CCMP2293]